MSSIILMVIVVAWAVVLVPMLLNRHEAANEARSVDRFATAMRVLSRRTATSGDRRYVVVPSRPQSPPQVVANGGHSSPDKIVKPSRHRMAMAVRALAGAGVIARRRRIVLSLAALAVVAAVAALVVSPLLWRAQLGCDALFGLYLWQVRRAVSTARDRHASTSARATDRPAASGYARAMPAPQFAVPVPDNAVVIERQQDGSWKPVPVPLPTYVTAPVARPAAAPAAAPARPAAEGISVNGRAVNE